jgi:hypothetical protein
MTSFLHARVRQLLFSDIDDDNTELNDSVNWIDSSTRLFNFDALQLAAAHDFVAHGGAAADESFQFYVEYSRFVHRLAKQCQQIDDEQSLTTIDRVCSLLSVTANLDNVCRALYCARYRVRKAPKKLREVLVRFVDDSAPAAEVSVDRRMILLFRLLHHTCGALNSINFRNVIWHGFASAHEIDRLGAFAALLHALLLNVRHFGALWVARDSIPSIQEPLLPLVYTGARNCTALIDVAEFGALVQQSPLVCRESEQERFYIGMLQLLRSGRKRDFSALMFSTLEASLRVLFVRTNAAAFGAEMIEFQLDYDSLFISYAMLLNDTLFSKDVADDGSGAYAYNFRTGDRNLLLDRIPGDTLAALRELVFDLEIRDRLAHGLLHNDSDISDFIVHAQFDLLVALLRCRFEPLPVQELRARQHVPSFGIKRAMVLALQELERAESDAPFDVYYRLLDTDALFVHEDHGRLARFCKSMCETRQLTDAAVASVPVGDEDDNSKDAHGGVPKHLALYRDALHGVVFVRSAQLVRRWLSELETSRDAVTSVRLARVEILAAQLLDCARRGVWGRFNLLAYHSGVSLRDQREHDLFGGIGRSSVMRKDDERLVNLIKHD